MGTPGPSWDFVHSHDVFLCDGFFARALTWALVNIKGDKDTALPSGLQYRVHLSLDTLHAIEPLPGTLPDPARLNKCPLSLSSPPALAPQPALATLLLVSCTLDRGT